MRFVLPALFLGLMISFPALAGAEGEAAQLREAAREHLQKVERTLRPNEANKAVSQNGNHFVASYLVVDSGTLHFEVKGAPGEYVGNITYVVHEYQCVGNTEQEARSAPCRKAKSRRMREFTRYTDGAWQF